MPAVKAYLQSLCGPQFGPDHSYPSIGGGSRHSARGLHNVADPDIWLRGTQFNMFPSISRFFSSLEGAKVYSQTGWVMAGFSSPEYATAKHSQGVQVIALLGLLDE